MKNSRRQFLAKGPVAALGVGAGLAAGKTTLASPPTPEGTRQLLEAVIAGQKQINGRLYAGSDLILEVLRMIIPHVQIDPAAANAKLSEAEGYIDAVPGIDPPGCCYPGQVC